MLSNRRIHIAHDKNDRILSTSHTGFFGSTNIFNSTILFLCSSKSNRATIRKASDILVKRQAGNYKCSFINSARTRMPIFEK